MKNDWFFWQQIIKGFIHAQNADFNMYVTESHEKNLYCVIFK